MDDFGKRTRKLGTLYALAALVGFGLSLAQGRTMEISIVAGIVSAGLLFVLVTILLWRP